MCKHFWAYLGFVIGSGRRPEDVFHDTLDLCDLKALLDHSLLRMDPAIIITESLLQAARDGTCQVFGLSAKASGLVLDLWGLHVVHLQYVNELIPEGADVLPNLKEAEVTGS